LVEVKGCCLWRLMLCLLLRKTNSEPKGKTLNHRHRLVEDRGDYDVTVTVIVTVTANEIE
jgi:hypothetical protein